MANEMLTGLLNQTSGGNWWGGTGAQTSGYGSYSPPPPQPAQEEAPPPIASDPVGGAPATPATPATSAGPTAEQQRDLILKKNLTARLQQKQLTLNQLQTQLGYYQPGSLDYRGKQSQINTVSGEIRELQMKISFLSV